jgi:hypothetical protein
MEYCKYDNTPEGWFIVDADKYNKIKSNPKLYKRKKLLAYLWFLIPLGGIIGYVEYMEENFGVQVL